MSWIRVDANRHTHPRARELEAWGAVVLEAVWEIVKVHGRRGKVTASAVTPEAVTEWLRFDRESGGPWVEKVAEGLERCFASGALSRDGDRVIVRDWHQYQTDPTNAERQARFRERDDSNGSNALRRYVTDSNGCNADIGEGTIEDHIVPDSGTGFGLSSPPAESKPRKKTDPAIARVKDTLAAEWTKRHHNDLTLPAKWGPKIASCVQWIRKNYPGENDDDMIAVFATVLEKAYRIPEVDQLHSRLAKLYADAQGTR